ncbi:MAG: FecR domain-containing protein [Proteobacteria bacterium]|nr:FecR domain-containing protein [Pseudomonadota bacterium]
MQKSRNKQVYEEASEWVVELHLGEMDAAARERLDAWFRRSPEHIRAFLQISCLCEELEDSKLDLGYNLDALIARARASTKVITLAGESGASSRQAPVPSARVNVSTVRVGIARLSRLVSWRSAVLASLLLACSGLGLVGLNAYRHTHFATGTGEQRIAHLADGSIIELNSESRVRIRFSEREREVELVEGQALFKVAKDLTRPFVVQSAGTRVRAVGTQFDVYRKASGTQVTVLEGRVAVFAQEALPPAQLTADRSTSEAGSPSVLVSTGEQVTVTDQEVPRPRPADVRAATAWTQRELVFEMTPLAEVAQEFNRYNRRKLVISDPIVATFHVTGVFPSADPGLLLRFLRAQQGIHVVEAGGEIRISRK